MSDRPRLFIRLSVNDFSSGRRHYLSLMKILKKKEISSFEIEPPGGVLKDISPSIC